MHQPHHKGAWLGLPSILTMPASQSIAGTLHTLGLTDPVFVKAGPWAASKSSNRAQSLGLILELGPAVGTSLEPRNGMVTTLGLTASPALGFSQHPADLCSLPSPGLSLGAMAFRWET